MSKQEKAGQRQIKCIVWDLDETLWQGTVLEGDNPTLRRGVVEVIQELDRRGILHSIASKNDFDVAMNKLIDFGLKHYFLYPQIGWNSKALCIKQVAEALNIGLDAIAFVDDQEVERAEVLFSHPDVLCLDSGCIDSILDMSEFKPRFVTDDSARRRHMYLSDMQRQQAEVGFGGTKVEFLEDLQMILNIFPAEQDDLARVEELTVRTHQLNTTGYTYSYEELSDTLRHSDQHLLLLGRLEDKFGSYGTIGLVLVETTELKWTIKLLLMSCRVMSRGIGTVFINHIASLAKLSGAQLFAEFVPNGRNRSMLLTYRLTGFKPVDIEGIPNLFQSDLSGIQPFPTYLTVRFTK